ncbi:hypothetical protein MD484_g3731, partial [Candolleomyces efflorescens]
MTFTTLEKYEGQNRRLLLAFDIGAIFSGISYSVLEPGKVPVILPVTCYPSQDRTGGDIKIPTVIYYDTGGRPCATGAETLAEGIEEDAEGNGWSKAQWHGLGGFTFSPETIPPLPLDKTIVQVFADYMRYLYECAKAHIKDTHGEHVWRSLNDDITYILTHPNGWGGAEQAQMRNAAIQAGLISDTHEGRSRVTFVTEGEASLHFCLANGLSIAGGNEDAGVLIVDAGGGTIDVTSYRKLKDDSFEEIAIPTCETTKQAFRRDDEQLRIQFASESEDDEYLNIRSGCITIDGDRVAKFFEPSIECIVEAIKTQQNTAHYPIKSVFFVGGFSASPWLYEKVREATESLGVAVSRPDTHVNKAVANGAVLFYLDGAVKSRVARMTYGIETSIGYDPSDPSHVARKHLVKPHSVHGDPELFDYFSSILTKNTRVKDTTEFRTTFWAYASDISGLKQRTTILAYSGELDDPQWMRDELENYQPVCIVEADTSLVKPEILYSRETRSHYYMISFDIILQFGLTELKAQIAYIDSQGVEQRGRARVVYEDASPTKRGSLERPERSQAIRGIASLIETRFGLR